MKYSFSYIVSLQFLGFRFSGWQKQTNAKTLHEMLDKTLSFVLHARTYKTIGMSRTDAKVSANVYFFQLFVDEKLNEIQFLEQLNSNFSADLRVQSIQEVGSNFNIIKAAKRKEYHYYFSFGQKNHPFAAPFLSFIEEDLDIQLMIKGARLFQGSHFFHKYCTKPSVHTIFKRSIDTCEIIENDILRANFFPEKSYVLKVVGKGFLRYQIRLMMAVLFELGKKNIDLTYIENSLKKENDKKPMRNIAPASGLQLYHVDLEI